MAVNNKIRRMLELKLLGDLKHLLWSYRVSNVKKLSDDIIIEKYLLFGNESDWKNLGLAFSSNEIKSVWEGQLLLAGFQIEKQKQLVAYFFKASNPKKYISDHKKEKLEKLISNGKNNHDL